MKYSLSQDEKDVLNQDASASAVVFDPIFTGSFGANASPNSMDRANAARALLPSDKRQFLSHMATLNTMSDVHMLSIAGGGAAYDWSMVAQGSQAQSWSFLDQDGQSWATNFHAETYIKGLGGGVLYDQQNTWKLTKTFQKDIVTDKATTTAFHISDGNVGDAFDIQIRVDPVYATPVFRTVSGRSRCVWENNTAMRDKPLLTLDSGLTLLDVDDVDPASELEYTLKLINDSETSEAFTYVIIVEPGTNPHGLAMFINWYWIDGFELTDMQPGSNFYSLRIRKGPTNHYSYQGVQLSLFSACEYGSTLTHGSPRTPVKSTLTINIDYIQPCPAVQWAGIIGRENGFVVNNATVAAYAPETEKVEIVVMNPDSPSLPWASNPRLTCTSNPNVPSNSEYYCGVWVEYRTSASDMWVQVVDANSEWVDLRSVISGGFATYEWDVSDIADGAYQLRVKTKCDYDGTLNDEFNSGSTPIITGVIDRGIPEVFGLGPSGDLGAAPISVTFSEAIRCKQVSSLMTVPGASGATVALEVKCSGSTLQFAPAASAWVDYYDEDVTLVIDDVYDLAGNPFRASVSFDFTLTQDWQCLPAPTNCDTSGANKVYCDYDELNFVCTACNAGWTGDDCSESSRPGVQSVEHERTRREELEHELHGLRESFAQSAAKHKENVQHAQAAFEASMQL